MKKLLKVLLISIFLSSASACSQNPITKSIKQNFNSFRDDVFENVSDSYRTESKEAETSYRIQSDINVDIDVFRDETLMKSYFPKTGEDKSEVKLEETKIQSIPEKPDGNAGRFIYGDFSVGLNTPTYSTNENAQSIVNNTDSAIYYDTGYKILIGDHAHQGFNVIKKAVPYETVAKIKNGNNYTELICVGIDYNASNTRDNLVLSDGTSAFDYDASIITYVCNDKNGYSVSIVFWNYR